MEEINRKLNILLVHNYYKIPGGEDVVVKNEKKMLIEHNKNVFEYYKSNSDINKGILNKIKLAFNSIYSIKTYNEVKKIIEENNIDIVHVHNILAVISPSVYYAAFKMKVPIVKTLHNFRFVCPKALLFRDNNVCKECIEHNMLKSIKYKCYRDSKIQTILIVLIIKIHRILKTFDKINAYIALTDFDKEILKSRIDENRIYVKPNFTYGNKENADKENYFMYVGRLDEVKGIKVLIENFKKIDKSKLYVFGEGPLKEEILKYIKDNKLDNIILMGYADKKTILSYLSRAKALIVPSQCLESFGMVIIEAFSVGTTVIGKNIGSIGTIIKDNVNGILFNDNNELYEKINLINKDKVLLDRLTEGAVNSSGEYTADTNYKILMKIYIKAINDCKK